MYGLPCHKSWNLVLWQVQGSNRALAPFTPGLHLRLRRLEPSSVTPLWRARGMPALGPSEDHIDIIDPHPEMTVVVAEGPDEEGSGTWAE